MKTALAVALVCLSVAPSRADRDIVYSARYYNPPASKAVSHHHLYRINPDGTGRTQLTSGDGDDYMPRWSPDGKNILFYRKRRNQFAYHILHAQSGRMTRIMKMDTGRHGEMPFTYEAEWRPDGRGITMTRIRYLASGDRTSKVWDVRLDGKETSRPERGTIVRSPDTSRAYVVADSEKDWIVDRDGKRTTVADRILSPVWLDNRSLVGVKPELEPEPILRLLGVDGKETRNFHINTLRKEPPIETDAAFWEVTQLVPRTQDKVICRQNLAHAMDGVRRIWGWNIVDLANGKMDHLMDGSTVSFEPGGRRFVAVPSTVLTPYGPKRKVMTAPLEVISLPDKKIKTLVSGTVWVWSADWRNGRNTR